MSKKILIFDDDVATLEVVSIICRDLGYEVDIAETADDVLSKVEFFLPNLIMMDINIPMIGGVEATRLIKAHDTHREIPVVFITAKNDVALLSSQAHADGYLSKPFDIEELEDIVERLI
ncbi:response regulator [Chryseobacterium sp. FH1]|uniref:response regulator n=1 Tax=Chryseobacterium sp. FH1 TaxID=1233951 RepID=UPI0004E33D0F|nr:response regulator [Chryseobacterium sp. FH1]KFC20337.1 response regulator receiver protein [Chryseobacterium sp. FH1]